MDQIDRTSIEFDEQKRVDFAEVRAGPQILHVYSVFTQKNEKEFKNL